MGYKSFDQRRKERRALERATFSHRFDTPAKVKELVEQRGKRADEQLPGLYEQREKQRANVEILKIVGGEPLEKAQETLWQTNRQIEYDEPWQQLRDCLAAKLVTIEITPLFVHFGYALRRGRICRYGPHEGLEFGQTGQRVQLTKLATAARATLKLRGNGKKPAGGSAKE